MALQRRCESLVRLGREVVVAGDINLTHNEIDHCDPQKWLREAGATTFHDDPGRRWLHSFLKSPDGTTGVMVDFFRALNPGVRGAYTCWRQDTGARANNYGTRIDYVLATPALAARVSACEVWQSATGSDHCPVAAILDVPPAPRRAPPPLCARFMPEFQGATQGRLTAFLARATPKRPTEDDAEAPRPAKRTRGPSQATLAQFFGPKQPKGTAIASRAPDANCDPVPPVQPVFAEPPSARPGPTAAVRTAGDGDVSPSPSGHSADSADSAFLSTRCDVPNPPAPKAQWRALLKGPQPPPLCMGHGEPCVERTVKKEGANSGRRFYVCWRPQGHRGDPPAATSLYGPRVARCAGPPSAAARQEQRGPAESAL
eukprot:Opistho-1_new@59548